MARHCDGFHFVVVPACPEEAIYQVYQANRSVQYDDLSFVRKVREILGIKAEAPQLDEYRESLRKDLLNPASIGSPTAEGRQSADEKERLEDALRKVGGDQLEHLQCMLSLKVVALSKPSQCTGNKGVFLFHDARSSDTVNTRAADLCCTAGLPPKEIRGPCVLSRTEEVIEKFCKTPIWCRCDFTLADCASHASWLREAFQHRVESGLKREDDAKWFEGLKDCELSFPSGAIEGAVWHQTADEIDVCFHAGPLAGIRASTRDVAVKHTRRTLFVRLRGRVLCDLELAGEVDPSNCYWTLDRDTFLLQVTLCKSSPTAWNELARCKALDMRHGPQDEDHRAEMQTEVSQLVPRQGCQGQKRCWKECRVMMVVLLLLLYYFMVLAAWILSKMRERAGL